MPDQVCICEECGLPNMALPKKRDSSRTVHKKFKKTEERVNSNEVPNHRIKSLFTLPKYISESDGVVGCPRKQDAKNFLYQPAGARNVQRTWGDLKSMLIRPSPNRINSSQQ